MPVNPLDLQVNFSQINQVSKQQSNLKEGEVDRQDKVNTQIQKDGEKSAEDIPETKELQQGPGKIKDEKKQKSANKENKKAKVLKKGSNAGNDEGKKEDKIEVDPNLGKKIDILG